MKYYFIDKEIYYQNKKLEKRKVELFDVNIQGDKFSAYDKDGNLYILDIDELIEENKE